MPRTLRPSRRLRRDLLATTALTLGLGLASAGSVQAQSSYAAGGGTVGNTNNDATALGSGATANGDRSLAAGYGAQSPGADSTALGSGAASGGNGSFAGGYNASSGGASSTAIGPGASGGGDESFAGGYNASAPGNGAVAIGSGASAQTASQPQGIINYRDNNGVGIPSAAAGGNFANGSNGSVRPPNEVTTSGAQPTGTAIGKRSTVGAAGGVAIGYNNTANNGTYNSTAIGVDNVAGGSYGTAIGYGNIASGRSTLSLGTGNQATGDIAIALGRQSYAVGDYSFAQGFVASAYGQDAIAIGRLSIAGITDGSQAHNIAIGDNASATGGSALALGSGAGASSSRAVAIGAGSMALRGAISGAEAYSGNALSAANSEFSVGAAGAERQITNVAGGQQDTDAVNVRQLRGLGNTLGTTLGGSFDASNAYTAPTYSYAGRSYSTVPALTGALDTFALRYDGDGSGNRLASIDVSRGGTIGGGSGVAMTGLAPATANDGAVALSQMPLRYSTSGSPTTANPAVPSNDATLVGSNAGQPVVLHNVAPGSVASASSTDAVNGGQLHQTNQNVAALQNGTAGLVQQDPSSRTITVGSATDGRLVDLTGTQGTRRLTGLSDGIGASDAATMGQLRLTANALGGGAAYDTSTGAFTAPSYAVGGRTYNDVGSALAATNSLAVQYVPDGNGAPTAAIDLTRGGALSTVALRGVANGAVNANSTDAVNGSQLYAVSQGVRQNTTDLQTLNQGVSNGTIGLVQQDPSSRTITVGGATDGTRVVFSNSQGTARTLTGVAAGGLFAGSTEAVNGGQLFQTNQSIAALQTGTAGLVQQDPTTRRISVGGATDGTAIDFTNQGGSARTLAGVAAGQVAAASTQAVNGGQIYASNASIASALGGGAGVAPDGTLTAPRYIVQGTTFNNVGSALGSLDAAVTNINTTGTKYLAVRSTGAAAQAQGADSVAVGPNAVVTADRGVALGANALASRAGMGGAKEAFSAVSVASTQGAVSVGDAGSERQITNVAGGTQATDAVNLRQLQAAGGNLAGALGGGSGFAKDGSFTAPAYTIAGRQYASVGAAFGAVDTYGVKYDVDPATGGRGQSITLAGGDPNQPVLIRNVAAGVLASDAANVGQVAQARADAMAYTDAAVAPLQQQVNAFGAQLADLGRQVGEARIEARRAAAIGLAAASLRFDDRPGKLSVAAGGGAWRGETAAAFGVGYSLPDGSGRVNATGVAAGRDFGVGAGASFTLN